VAGHPNLDRPLPSLLRTTIRRSVVLGRVFLAIGLIYSVVLTLSLSASPQPSFDSSVPLLLPLFAVLGSMGGMLAFSNDRMKGVFEYLVAYGIRPRSLFAYSLIASLAVMTILVGVSVALAFGVSYLVWHSLSLTLVEAVGLYSIPMGYASAALASMVGMYWTVLSSPRTGMNSPIGLIPAVGIAPSVITLVAVGAIAATYGTGAIPVVQGIALALTLGAALVLLSLTSRLLRTERLLSPM
jgi:hypothetical protein